MRRFYGNFWSEGFFIIENVNQHHTNVKYKTYPLNKTNYSRVFETLEKVQTVHIISQTLKLYNEIYLQISR